MISAEFYDFFYYTQWLTLCVRYLAQTRRLGDSTCRLPHLILSASARNRAPCERKGCVQSPASHVLCTLAPLNTHSHITHKDRPRLHSPQAPFAMKGRKWVREREREKGKEEKKKTEEKSRGELNEGVRRLRDKKAREIIGLWGAEWIVATGLDTLGRTESQRER